MEGWKAKGKERGSVRTQSTKPLLKKQKLISSSCALGSRHPEVRGEGEEEEEERKEDRGGERGGCGERRGG